MAFAGPAVEFCSDVLEDAGTVEREVGAFGEVLAQVLRQYFPKGTDLNAYGPEDLEHVAQELNARPRKTLDWDTPAERLRDVLVVCILNK